MQVSPIIDSNQIWFEQADFNVIDAYDTVYMINRMVKSTYGVSSLIAQSFPSNGSAPLL